VRYPIPGGDHIHRLACLFERDVRFESGDCLEVVAATLQGLEIGHFGGTWHPDLSPIEGKRRCRFRQHADDRVRRSVEYQHLFDKVTRVKLCEVLGALRCILWDTRTQRIISIAEYQAGVCNPGDSIPVRRP